MLHATSCNGGDIVPLSKSSYLPDLGQKEYHAIVAPWLRRLLRTRRSWSTEYISIPIVPKYAISEAPVHENPMMTAFFALIA